MATYDCFINIGHGKRNDGVFDPGACSGNYQEHDIATKIVNNAVPKIKSKGINIFVTEQNYYNHTVVKNVYKYKYGISVHLNAGGGKRAEIYTPCKDKNLDVEFYIMNELNKLGLNNGGVKSRDYNSGVTYIRTNGVSLNCTDYYGEINNAYANGISLDILETGFIDSTDVNIILNNIDKIGTIIANAYCMICDKSLYNEKKVEPKWVKDKWGWWYDNGDGTYPKSEWLKLNGIWYYFDDKGYAYQNKWLLWKKLWYYFDNDCKMVTSKWVEYKGDMYYLKADGSMAVNCEIDGYIINGNGVGTKKEEIKEQKTDIIGKAEVSKEKMLAWAKNKNNNEEYLFVMDLAWEMAEHLGIRPDVVCCQISKETGYLYKNGSAAGLDVSFHNPCGLKITQGGGDYVSSAHMKFPSWEHGILAYLDHLALYVGLEGYPLEEDYTLDPRHFPYLKGTVKYVEDLGGKWCPNVEYGKDIVKMVNEIKQM